MSGNWRETAAVIFGAAVGQVWAVWRGHDNLAVEITGAVAMLILFFGGSLLYWLGKRGRR